MVNFTPVPAFLGGVLIGLSVLLLMLTNGRIAGVSGIVGGLLARNLHEAWWRLAFVLGLVASPLLLASSVGGVPPITVTPSTGLLVAGGLLVGFGARLGSGCTSGHGVAGLARLSPRSAAATGTFVAAGMATVFVARHLIGG